MRCLFAALTLVVAPAPAGTARVKQQYPVTPQPEADAELCSTKRMAGCKFNWNLPLTDNSAACAWLSGKTAWFQRVLALNISGGGICVPNCHHPLNANEARCEKSFCVWTGVSCQFNPVSAHARRTFCDEHVGIQQRRMVNQHGEQTSFYDVPLRGRKRLFCEGMLGDNDDRTASEGRTVEDVMLASMMRCWHPRPGNRDMYWDPGAQKDMVSQLGQALHGEGLKSAENIYPLLMADRTVFNTPFRHVFVGLVNRIKAQQTTFCQEFDYTGASATTLDEYGCGFFQASFQPLQKLTKCIITKMDADPLYKLWQAVAGKVVDRSNKIQNRTSQALFNEIVKTNEWALEESTRLSVDIRQMVRQYQKCPHPACVKYFGRYDRAYEIIKQVEWDSWEGLRSSEVFKLLDLRLKSTLATPVDSDPPALTDATRHAIMDECFGVTDVEDEVNDDAAFLKESLACKPLMADYQQVPHPPKRALWPRYSPDLGDPKVREAWYKGEGDNHGASVKEEFKNVHPLCARMALSGLLPSFSRTQYPFKKPWLMAQDVLWHTETRECLTLDTSHCITFTECWKTFLQRHAPSIASACRPDEPHTMIEDVDK